MRAQIRQPRLHALGVEVHAVHEGYLLDCFAMSLFNKRTDKYGGDLNGRLRFAIEIVQKIKQYCGEDFPGHPALFAQELYQGSASGRGAG